jgi:putative RNA 2'-phosphotransferase
MSHALRHEPWLYELELDAEGWTNVSALLAALRTESPVWSELTEEDVAEVITLSSKRRHELVNGRIRALYGHSIPGTLRKVKASPPPRLFHGTTPASSLLIQREGLLPMGRQFVHLSTDRETAIAVSKRKSSEPTILLILADESAQAGVSFYLGNEKVWLADRVPPEFIEIADPPVGKLRRRRHQQYC